MKTLKKLSLLIQKLKLPFKLSAVTILATIFLHQSKSKCGSYCFGLPLKFIRTTCDCTEHLIPINILNLGIDIVYHLVIWSALIYLWKDAKDTWAMIRNKNLNTPSR